MGQLIVKFASTNHPEGRKLELKIPLPEEEEKKLVPVEVIVNGVVFKRK